MSISFELKAAPRAEVNSRASRRLRRAGKLPAILYGGKNPPQAITLDHDQVLQQLQYEAFYSHILTVKLDGGGEEKVVLRDLHRHPHKPKLLHMDLQRISETEKLHVNVPLHFMGEEVAPGVKRGGGIVSHLLTEVEVLCLPRNLPEYLEVDLSKLGVNESLHLSDIKVPNGVELLALSRGPDHDAPVATIIVPRGAGTEEAAAEAAEEAKPEETPPATEE